jgi:hypothetical protein
MGAAHRKWIERKMQTLKGWHKNKKNKNIMERKKLYKQKSPTFQLGFFLSSPGKTRTCNPAVNSRMLCH